MNAKQVIPQHLHTAPTGTPTWSCAAVKLDADVYAAALRFLFDRPAPDNKGQEWFWNMDEPEFTASPLEWTLIQTVLFANAGADLAAYSDEQVGMGLNYVMSNAVSDVPNHASDPSVPLGISLNMMQAFPHLWRDCIGPRQAHVKTPIGYGIGRLNYVCYMWFDVWPTFWQHQHIPQWRDAHWSVLSQLLDIPCREVQIAALHGIGHDGEALQKTQAIAQRMQAYIQQIDNDPELLRYAQNAAVGCVQ